MADAATVAGRSHQQYTSDTVTHDGYGQPRGPFVKVPEETPATTGNVLKQLYTATQPEGETNPRRNPPAIGFCPHCHANARATCSNRGMFDCPDCTLVWFDTRVGEQTRSIEDYFVNMSDDQASHTDSQSVPDTDQGNSTDDFETTWRSEYDTQDYNAEVFPAPGEWFVDDVEAAGVTWYYDIPRTEDGEPDYAAESWDCDTARLVGDLDEQRETLTFRIAGDQAFEVEIDDRGEERHSPWVGIDTVFQTIADALYEYHIGGKYTAVTTPPVGLQQPELGEYYD